MVGILLGLMVFEPVMLLIALGVTKVIRVVGATLIPQDFVQSFHTGYILLVAYSYAFIIHLIPFHPETIIKTESCDSFLNLMYMLKFI